MKDGKEPMVGLLIGAKPKKKDDDMGDAKMAASEAVMAAFKDGDVSALNEALTLHYDACRMSEGGGDEYEDD